MVGSRNTGLVIVLFVVLLLCDGQLNSQMYASEGQAGVLIYSENNAES
jgi:hypothetical protein